MDKREATLRVFGHAFSFETGQATPDVEEAYRVERYMAALTTQNLVWVARALDAEFGVAADLYFRGIRTLLLDYDFDSGLTDVYENPIRGLHDGSLIVDRAPFEAAVEQAEAYLAPRLEIVKRNGQL